MTTKDKIGVPYGDVGYLAILTLRAARAVAATAEAETLYGPPLTAYVKAIGEQLNKWHITEDMWVDLVARLAARIVGADIRERTAAGRDQLVATIETAYREYRREVYGARLATEESGT